jgi:lipopolysaccharide export LptBFGC system permease protein LptF
MLPVIIGIILIILAIYFTIKMIGEFKKFINGEYDMIERLEVILANCM